jgi:hypothetical protein
MKPVNSGKQNLRKQMAKVFVPHIVEYDAKYLVVEAEPRYWEDATVDGKDDELGTKIPCREGEAWCPVIDVDTGQIVNWTQGITASVHYKVCDAGVYELQTSDKPRKLIVRKDGYVPRCLSPGDNGYGDYIIMNIDENGIIENWKFDDRYFEETDG